MVLLASIALLVGAVFNVVVWPSFYRRVSNDPRARDANGRPTRFLTVHAVLVLAALIIGIAQALLGILLLTN
ncbi:SCO4848 family membrane protein [Pseudoclavibacter helvolus]|uniref:SCO4848 family membrane protein n=1 Tax=Pseudoclavibacter helvolus TaxID=255205 RepID=UPI003C77B7E8